MAYAEARGRRKPASLRVYLLALTAAVLLPALAVGAAAVWTAVEGQRAAFTDGLQGTARALALAIDSEIDTFRSAMATLAGSGALDGPEPDLAAFEREARRAAEALGTPVVALLDPTTLRQLVNTGMPPGERPDASAAEVFRQVAETGRPLVTDVILGGISRRHVIGVAVPVVRRGEVRHVLAARLEPARLASLLAAQARDGSFASVIDGRNIVIARSRDHDRFVGQRVLDWIVEGTAGREAGLLRGANRLGEVSLSAFRRLNGSPGWMVIVGEPIAVYEAAVWRPIRALAYGTLAVLALGLVAALGIGALVLRPVRALTRQAEVVAAGDGAAGPAAGSASSRIAEFEQLREAAQRAEATLRAERDRARLYFDVAGAVLLVLAPDGTVRAINRHGLEVLGLDREEEAVGRDWIASFIPRRLQAEMRQVFAAVATGETGPWTFGSYENPVLRADGTERLVAWRNAVLRDDAGRLLAVVSSGEDITEARAVEAHQRLLVQEVDHRAKNVLAVVQSILRLTPADDPVAFRAAVEKRVAALGRAHSLLARRQWRAADLRALLEAELVAHQGPRTSVRVNGPPLPVSPAAAQSVAMLTHELATNAAKHGALSAAGGQLTVGWCAGDGPGGDGLLHLRWAEEGGPTVAGAPARRGFGSRVIEAVVRSQLGGTIERRWERTGLIVEVALPLGRVLVASEEPPAASADPVLGTAPQPAP